MTRWILCALLLAAASCGGDDCCGSGERCIVGEFGPVCACGEGPPCEVGRSCEAAGPVGEDGCGTICCGGPDPCPQ